MLDHVSANFQHYLSGTPLIAFAATFVMGILVSFTPCVYPMIPITVAYIGGGSAGRSRLRGLALSVFYVLGLSVTYAALGIIGALANKIFGFAASSPIVNIIVGVFFVIFGLSMMELFNIPVPSFLTNMQPKQRGGFVGALVFGLLSGFIAVPCSTPVLLAILTHIAQHGGVVYGFLLMFTYACGFGILFIFIGAGAGAILSLPKSGAWMVWIKRLCGAALIALGLYFTVSSTLQFSKGPGGNHGGDKQFVVAKDASAVTGLIGKKPLMLIFFGSWCKACAEEIPELNKISADYSAKNIEILGIAVNDTEPRAVDFMKKYGIKYKVILDASGAIADKFEIVSAPTTVIIGRDGKEIYRGADSPAKTRQFIDKALATIHSDSK